MSWLNWPNRITLSRIILLPPFIIALINLQSPWPGWRYLALALFALMGLSDAIDGYLARRLRQITALGRFLDPVADKLLVTASLILLAVPDTSVPGFRIPSWVPVVAIGKDAITLLGFTMIYMATGKTFIRPRPLGKLCTLLQLLLIGFALAGPNLPPVVQAGFPALWWIASAVAVAAVVDYVRLGNAFASRQLRTEPRP